jgi:hypothetical protein
MSTLKLSLFDGKCIRAMMVQNDIVIKEERYSVFDFINYVCEKKNNNSYGQKTFERMIDDSSKYKDNIIKYVYYVQYPGKGQRKTPTMNADGLLSLLMILGGKVADTFRNSTLKILHRYLEGDLSMRSEIVKNSTINTKVNLEAFTTSVLSEAQEKEDIYNTSYIYASYSDAFPNLVKIGRSQNVTARLSSGNTFCRPSPHQLLCIAPTLDAIKDEANAHAYFAKYRKEGEFFEISKEEVETYFQGLIAPRSMLASNAASSVSTSMPASFIMSYAYS